MSDKREVDIMPATRTGPRKTDQQARCLVVGKSITVNHGHTDLR